MNSSSELPHDLSSTSHLFLTLTQNFRQGGQTRSTRYERVQCLSSFPFSSHLSYCTYLPPHFNQPTPHPLNLGAQFLILIPLSLTPPSWSITISYLLTFINFHKYANFGKKERIEATAEFWNVLLSLPCLQHAPPQPLAHLTSSKMDANMKWTNINPILGKGIYDFWFGEWRSILCT